MSYEKGVELAERYSGQPSEVIKVFLEDMDPFDDVRRLISATDQEPGYSLSPAEVAGNLPLVGPLVYPSRLPSFASKAAGYAAAVPFGLAYTAGRKMYEFWRPTQKPNKGHPHPLVGTTKTPDLPTFPTTPAPMPGPNANYAGGSNDRTSTLGTPDHAGALRRYRGEQFIGIKVKNGFKFVPRFTTRGNGHLMERMGDGKYRDVGATLKGHPRIQRQYDRSRQQYNRRQAAGSAYQSRRGPRGAYNLDSKQKSDGLKISSTPQSGGSFLPYGVDRFGVHTMQLRVFMDSVKYTTTGKVMWQPNIGLDATDLGGQWYALATSKAYFGAGNPLADDLRFFEEWQLSGEIEFVPCISGFSNPTIRMSVLTTTAIDWAETLPSGSFVTAPVTPNSSDTLIRSAIMSNPAACSKAGWTDTGFKCAFPNTGNRWFKTNSPAASATYGLFAFTETISNMRQACPFACFVNISGELPASTLTVADVYLNLTIKARGQRSYASKGATARPPLDLSLAGLALLDKKLDQLLQQCPEQKVISIDQKSNLDDEDDDLLYQEFRRNKLAEASRGLYSVPPSPTPSIFSPPTVTKGKSDSVGKKPTTT